MKLEYNITWFEDENNFFTSNISKIDSLYKFFNDKWFTLKVTIFHKTPFDSMQQRFISPKTFISLDKVSDYLPSTLSTKKNIIKNADLILVDYNLWWDRQNGDNIIQYIRDSLNDIYTEVLFYSTLLEEEELREKIQRDWLFYSKRENLLWWKKKLEKIWFVTIKKTQDLNNLRWLVMAETSDIDEVLRSILDKLVNNNNFILESWCKCTNCWCTNCSTGTCNPCSVCKRKVVNYKDRAWNNIFSLDKIKTTNVQAIFNAKSSWLLEAVSIFLWTPFNKTKYDSTLVDSYKTNIKHYRDLLAHAKENMWPNWEIIVKNKDWNEEIFTESTLIDIRKNIRNHKIIFEEIRDSL